MGKELFKKLAISEEQSKDIAVDKKKNENPIEVVTAIGFKQQDLHILLI